MLFERSVLTVQIFLVDIRALMCVCNRSRDNFTAGFFFFLRRKLPKHWRGLREVVIIFAFKRVIILVLVICVRLIGRLKGKRELFFFLLTLFRGACTIGIGQVHVII